MTEEDIDVCKKYKFKFSIPDNLDTTDSFNNKKISDIDPLDGLLGAEKPKETAESEDECEDNEDVDDEENIEDGEELSS